MVVFKTRVLTLVLQHFLETVSRNFFLHLVFNSLQSTLVGYKSKHFNSISSLQASTLSNLSLQASTSTPSALFKQALQLHQLSSSKHSLQSLSSSKHFNYISSLQASTLQSLSLHGYCCSNPFPSHSKALEHNHLD